MKFVLLLFASIFICVVQSKNYDIKQVPQKVLTMIAQYETAGLNLPDVETLKTHIASNSGLTRMLIRDAVKAMMENGIHTP